MTKRPQMVKMTYLTPNPAAIGKELGVPQNTIGDWLNVNGCHRTEAEIAKTPDPGENRLTVATAPRYLVVCRQPRRLESNSEIPKCRTVVILSTLVSLAVAPAVIAAVMVIAL